MIWWAGESKPRRRRKKNKGGENSLAGAKKRKLSQEQVNLLELNFGDEHKLESERKDRIALELGLDPRQVAVWFQNRRARWKNKKLEEEYSKLKSVHEGVVLEKCRLESEVYVSFSLPYILLRKTIHSQIKIPGFSYMIKFSWMFKYKAFYLLKFS